MTRPVSLAALLCAAACAPAAAQSDGNPHRWDRHRRCDHAGYSPKCGVCEGVGGIVWSDEPNDIIIAPCKPVASADQVSQSSLVRPVWGADFTELKSHEILIGKKNDPACFQAFPSNDSTSTNCYKPQEVRLYSDMKKVRALRLDANQAGNAWGIFGNVTSTIYHQGANMWIINHLPLGITQTVCTAPGGAPSERSRFRLQAMPGGSTFRIKCGSDGFPEKKGAAGPEPGLLELAEQPAGRAKACQADLQRARTRVPRPQYRGSNFTSMSETLNRWLRRHAPRSRECDSWTVEELQQLQVLLLLLRDPQLDTVYHGAGDNRRLRRDVQAMAREWEELNALAARDPRLARLHRDGHCHEAVMWYVHHVPEDIKAGLKDKVALPLLSYMRHDSAPPAPQAAKVHQAYEEKVTCASCHSAVFPSSGAASLVV